MDTAYSFNWKRRMKSAVQPLAIAAVLTVLLALFGTWGTWRFWVGLALIAILLVRAFGYLWWGRRELVIDALGVTRSGKTVKYSGAELELRAVAKGEALAISEVILWEPRDAEGKRQGVGFDDTLDRFEQATRAVVSRVPELRIVVSTNTEPNVQDGRREQVLAPLRPTAAERALLELGKSALSLPPHLRN